MVIYLFFNSNLSSFVNKLMNKLSRIFILYSLGSSALTTTHLPFFLFFKTKKKKRVGRNVIISYFPKTQFHFQVS